jgi:hypothetical protein
MLVRLYRTLTLALALVTARDRRFVAVLKERA